MTFTFFGSFFGFSADFILMGSKNIEYHSFIIDQVFGQLTYHNETGIEAMTFTFFGRFFGISANFILMGVMGPKIRST